MHFKETDCVILKLVYWHKVTQKREWMQQALIWMRRICSSRLSWDAGGWTGRQQDGPARLEKQSKYVAKCTRGNTKIHKCNLGAWEDKHLSSYIGSPLNTVLTLKFFWSLLKFKKNLASSYLTDLLHLYNPKRALRSSSQLLLVQPRSRLKTWGDRAFAIAAPRLWNNLPADIRMSESIQSFKSHLKTHLFTFESN